MCLFQFLFADRSKQVCRRPIFRTTIVSPDRRYAPEIFLVVSRLRPPGRRCVSGCVSKNILLTAGAFVFVYI